MLMNEYIGHTEQELDAIRDKLSRGTPMPASYRLMIQPIVARKGMEAAQAEQFEELAKAGFEVKTDKEQSRETHGSNVGVVIQAGPYAYKGSLEKQKPWCKVGDVVIFPRYEGHRVELPPGSRRIFHFMNDEDILGRYDWGDTNDESE